MNIIDSRDGNKFFPEALHVNAHTTGNYCYHIYRQHTHHRKEEGNKTIILPPADLVIVALNVEKKDNLKMACPSPRKTTASQLPPPETLPPSSWAVKMMNNHPSTISQHNPLSSSSTPQAALEEIVFASAAPVHCAHH